MNRFPVILILSVLCCLSCNKSTSEEYKIPPDAVSYLLQEDGSYKLFFHSKPFYLKGVSCFGGFEGLEDLGGNAIRIWDTDSTNLLLDKAGDHQLAVVLVLNVLSERQGMDYSNREMVLSQRARIRTDILSYKDHPAVLMWSLGNELDLDYQNKEVWKELDTLSQVVNAADGKHLTTTCVMPRKKTFDYLRTYCPSIQLIGINSFGYAPDVANMLRSIQASDLPYFFSEWGPKGYWEVPQTDWEASYESSSSQKLLFMSDVYKEHILKDEDLCLGGMAFFYGFKQERTHTWFSMFDEDGQPSDLVHGLSDLWKGRPASPRFSINTFSLNGVSRDESIYLRPGDSLKASIQVAFNKEKNVTGSWEIRREGTYRGINGGDKEADTSPIEGLILESGIDTCRGLAPREEGAYRLYYTVRDSSGRFGTANKCFFVMETE